MTERLRIGIIGCGVIAPSHVESFRLLEGVEVAVACDLIPERAQRLAGKYGIPQTTTDYLSVIDDPSIQAVSICTDHASHVPIALAAIGEGKHVICEKALAAHPEALEQLLDAAARRPDLVLAGIFQHRFDRIFQILRARVADGSFGTLVSVDARLHAYRSEDYYRSDAWRGTFAGEGGSALINQAIHFVDILQWIAGGVESLAAATANLAHQRVIQTEDSAVISMRLKGGALGSVVASTASPIDWEPTISVTGTAGLVEVRNGSLLRVSFRDLSAGERLRAEIESAAEVAGVAAAKAYYGPSHATQIADFVAAIREGRPPFVDFESAATGLRVVFAAYEAARSGRWVTP